MSTPIVTSLTEELSRIEELRENSLPGHIEEILDGYQGILEAVMEMHNCVTKYCQKTLNDVTLWHKMESIKRSYGDVLVCNHLETEEDTDEEIETFEGGPFVMDDFDDTEEDLPVECLMTVKTPTAHAMNLCE